MQYVVTMKIICVIYIRDFVTGRVKVKIHLEREVMILAQMNLQGKGPEQIHDHHITYLIAILRKKFQS
jgi:hypothetical protein